MHPKKLLTTQLKLFMLLEIVLLITFNVSTFHGEAAPNSSYFYKFTVNAEGFTNVEVYFNSTYPSSSSWIVVPKLSSWNYLVTGGSILKSQNLSTTKVGLEDLYFYQAFWFTYESTSSFSMKVQFDFDTGALIVENRGIFFSPQIGYQKDDVSSGKAEILFDSNLTVNRDKAIAIGDGSYRWAEIDDHRVLFNLPQNEDLLRLQVEFTTDAPPQSKTLTSKNGVFTFKTPSMYTEYASSLLNLYDRLYNNYTRLFNVTLASPLEVQFFLPSFDEFLTVGGFVPFSGTGAGKINVNIFFIRAVNGTIEVIATHELVHHFLIKAGLSPRDFLWFHEGMAQYVSVTLVEELGYEGAIQEKERLEQSASQLILELGGENFGFLQSWSPSFSPIDVGNYYIASYYVVSRLAQDYGDLDYYTRFFELIHAPPVDVYDIDVLTLYLSRAANASVAFTLQDWGFSVFDLTSPEIREKIVETQKAIAAVSPVFQPYKYLAEFVYRQALLSFRRQDMEGGSSLLQLAIRIARLAPLLTLLTVAALLGIIVYVLRKRSEKAKLKPTVPPPPPEIFSKNAQ